MKIEDTFLADKAASAVKKIETGRGKRLKKKVVTPPISAHAIKDLKSSDGKYYCGFAMREVMPDDVLAKDYWIAGHGPGRKIEGVHDPVTARAMWIGVKDEGGIILCSVDCIGLTNVEVTNVRNRLAGFCKSAKCKSVNISCTHSHAGFDTVGYWGKLPRTGKDPDYMEKLLSTIAEICREAYEKRTAGDLFVGSIHAPDGQLDRREPIVLHDTLTRLRFVPDDGSKETWFLNYAAHPNTLGGPNRFVSADYPYYLRETIYKSKDVNELFSVGAIGAVDPGPFSKDLPERTRMQGEYLGKKALEIDNDEKLDAEIVEIRQPFYIPADNAVLAFLAHLKVMSSRIFPSDEGALGLCMKTEMTYIRLGRQSILILPGENFPETVYGGYSDAVHSATGKPADINPKPLIDIAGDENLLVFGVTNDMTGYVVPPNDFILHPTQPYLSSAKDRFDRKHYHETNSLGINTQAKIAETFAGIIERINRLK